MDYTPSPVSKSTYPTYPTVVNDGSGRTPRIIAGALAGGVALIVVTTVTYCLWRYKRARSAYMRRDASSSFMAGSGQSTTLYSSQISSPIPAYFPPSSHDLPAYTPSPLIGPRSTAPSYRTQIGRSDRNATNLAIYGGVESASRGGFERGNPIDLRLR